MVSIFLPVYLKCVLGAQKNRLIETVLLSTHKICFGREIKKKIALQYALLSGGLFKKRKKKHLYFFHTEIKLAKTTSASKIWKSSHNRFCPIT